VALLYPSREELARVGLRLAAGRVPIQGASDHGTHEAIYLADPDGIGLELAADRPRSEWPDMTSMDAYRGGPGPLDQAGLFALVEGEQPTVPAADGVTVGHVHLQAGELVDELAFYRDVLGFDLVVHLGSAIFVSAGGYHHHVGVNTWVGERVGPMPADGVVGLRHWALVVPSESELASVRARLIAAGVSIHETPDGFVALDPAGIPVLVRT
jgi:catechol 2,3-dioxygenase